MYVKNVDLGIYYKFLELNFWEWYWVFLGVNFCLRIIVLEFFGGEGS